MRRAHHRILGTATLLLGLLSAEPSDAGELYISGLTGISAGVGTVDGENDFAFGGFNLSGDDVDSSPALGGALGFQFLLGDVINREIRLPKAIPWKLRMPNFNVRFEIEGVGARDYELKTDGFTVNTPYHSEVTSWSMMINNWLEMPVYPAVTAVFGRTPSLDPLSLYFGMGLGFAQSKVATSDSLVTGKATANNFAYQFGVGIAYDVTERFQISGGYRRVEMGSAKMDLFDGAGIERGDMKMDLHSNEAVLTLKTNFYSIPWPNSSTARRYDW